MANKTIVALFDEFDDAVKAVRALETGGFQHEDISLVANNVADRHSTQVTGAARGRGETEAAEGAGTGATIGVVIGGGAGLLAGLGMLAIPGVGPVVAAGPLIALITGAGVGAAAGGIIGGLVGLGVPEEEAHYYAEGVRRGGALVTASIPADQIERAVDIIEQHDPADVERRSATWRQTGWTRFDERAAPLDRDRVEAERAARPAAMHPRAGVGDGALAGAGARPAAMGGRDTTGTEPPSPADTATRTDATGIEGLPGSGGPVPARSAARPDPAGGARPEAGRVRSYLDPTADKEVRDAFDRAAAGAKPGTDADEKNRPGAGFDDTLKRR